MPGCQATRLPAQVWPPGRDPHLAREPMESSGTGAVTLWCTLPLWPRCGSSFSSARHPARPPCHVHGNRLSVDVRSCWVRSLRFSRHWRLCLPEKVNILAIVCSTTVLWEAAQLSHECWRKCSIQCSRIFFRFGCLQLTWRTNTNKGVVWFLNTRHHTTIKVGS